MPNAVLAVGKVFVAVPNAARAIGKVFFAVPNARRAVGEVSGGNLSGDDGVATTKVADEREFFGFEGWTMGGGGGGVTE